MKHNQGGEGRRGQRAAELEGRERGLGGCRPLRVGLIAACPFPASHGTPGGIREKAEALAELGHDVHVITYAAQQPQPVRGVKIHRIPAIGPVNEIVVGPSTAKMYWDVLLTLKTIGVVRSQNLDLLHGINYEGAMVGCLAKWVTGVPLVYGAVNTMIDELHTYKFIWPPKLAKMLAVILDHGVPRLADRVVCYTPTIRDFLLGTGVPESRVDVVRLGIDLSMFANVEANGARKRMGVGESDPLIMYTGVLNKFQRIDYLLRAMKRVLRELPTAKLAFVRTLDDEPERQEVERLAQREGVGEAVRYPKVIGFEELPEYIAAADTTAVPRPDCPGVPVKLLNFMASGKPVVVAKGSSQGLIDGVEALVTEDHNTEAIGVALVRALTDKPLAQRLGRRAYEVACARYERLAAANELVESYHRALASKGRSPQVALAGAGCA